MKLIRVLLGQVGHSDPAPLVLTIPVDVNNRISLKIPHAGWWGIPKGNSWCMPAIFRPDGMVDFGGDPEGDDVDRYSELQIFDRRFEIGERFYMKDLEDGEVSQFVVREIHDLTEAQ